MKNLLVPSELKKYTIQNTTLGRCVAVGAFVALISILHAEDLTTESQKASYILGRSMIQQLRKADADIDFKAVTTGVNEEIASKPERFKPEEMQKIMSSFETATRQRQEKSRAEKGEKNLKDGAEFLAANGKKEGVKTTSSGLQYKILEEGKGDSPTKDDSVKVHYEGTLLDGTVFDSSYKRGEPITFGVSQVIKGWTEALMLMKPGAKWELYIPADLAYGKNGTPGPIGPNATLQFKVELLEVVKKEAKTAKEVK